MTGPPPVRWRHRRVRRQRLCRLADRRRTRNPAGAVEAALGFVAGHPWPPSARDEPMRACMPSARSSTSIRTARRTPRAWVLGANTRLPPDIALQWAGEVAPDFHARHTAVRRIYRYYILNRSARSALGAGRTTWIHRPLDVDAMHAAAQVLLGEHDFSAFRSIECQSKIRDAARRAHQRGHATGDSLCIEITANAYLHHMVRNIVGTLLEVQGASDPPARWSAFSRAASGGWPAPRRPPRAFIYAGWNIPPRIPIPAPAGRFCYTDAHVLVRANCPLAHQDRAPYTLGARRSVDQMPGVRCGAVPGRDRAQPPCVPEMQPSHAHQRRASGC